LTLFTTQEFANWQGPPSTPIIGDGVLMNGNWMMIWGDQDTYKTFLVLDLAFSVATGEPWLVWETRKNNVLLINNELPPSQYQDRWKQLIKNKGVAPDNLFVINDTLLKLDTPQGLGMLTTWCAQTRPGLIIVDNLYRCFSGDMAKGPPVNAFLDTMAYIREQYDTAFVYVHHSRKVSYDAIHQKTIRQGLQDAYGSKFLTNNASTILEVRRAVSPNPQRYKSAITIFSEKMWFERSPPGALTFAVDSQAKFVLV